MQMALKRNFVSVEDYLADGEKRLAYQRIETLDEYMVVAQDRAEATIYRRSDLWEPQVIKGLDETITLNSINLSLPLSSIYEGVL